MPLSGLRGTIELRAPRLIRTPSALRRAPLLTVTPSVAVGARLVVDLLQELLDSLDLRLTRCRWASIFSAHVVPSRVYRPARGGMAQKE